MQGEHRSDSIKLPPSERGDEDSPNRRIRGKIRHQTEEVDVQGFERRIATVYTGAPGDAGGFEEKGEGGR